MKVAMPEAKEPYIQLTRAEINDLLERFSAADWKRAKRIAALLCQGLVDVSPDDLLQEALVNLLEGQRAWPAAIHPLVVIKTAMHSISSNARKHSTRSPIDETVQVDHAEDARGSKHQEAISGTTNITPEDELSGKQQIFALYALIAGDADLEDLVVTWADGLRGRDAMTALSWDTKKYDVARKRLERRLDTLNSERRKNVT